MRIDNIRFKTLEQIENLPIYTFDGVFQEKKDIIAPNFVFEGYTSLPSVAEMAIFKIRGNYLIPVKHDVPTFYGGFNDVTKNKGIFDISLMDLPPNESYVTIMKVNLTGAPKNDYLRSPIWIRR
ncbi:TPA: hypothetical protein QCX51_001947 [Bacillus mycoides]|nr:hypothetical protein [Bacillus mycoides]